MIIGLTGAVGSGKDTVADFLMKQYDFRRLAFADKVKDVAHVVFGWDREQLEGRTTESRTWREVVDPFWGLSPRTALQRIGTEMFRAHIHPETWIKAIVAQIRAAPVDAHIVVTDCRFPNEIQALKELGAVIFSVTRGTEPSWAADARAGKPCPETIHTTDWNVYRLQMLADECIENTGTLDELYDGVDKVLEPYMEWDDALSQN